MTCAVLVCATCAVLHMLNQSFSLTTCECGDSDELCPKLH